MGGEGTLTITTDSTPFANVAALKNFRFGKVDETFEGTQVTMTVPETDANGKTQATAAIDQLAETSLPLKANITIAIYEPGGRTTSDQISLPLRTRDTMLGVRPAFDGDSIQENTPANFEVVAVDAEGRPKAARGVTWELVNEDIDYRWYQVDNDWKYERVVNDRIVDGGKTDLDGAAAFKISKSLPWGSYRLTVADPASGATTAYRFWSGWGSGAGNDRPDRVAVAADKQSIRLGRNGKDRHQPADQRQGVDRHRLQQNPLHQAGRRFGLRHDDLDSGVLRMGLGRLRAGHALSPVVVGPEARARAFDRRRLDWRRSGAAYLEGRD